METLPDTPLAAGGTREGVVLPPQAADGIAIRRRQSELRAQIGALPWRLRRALDTELCPGEVVQRVMRTEGIAPGPVECHVMVTGSPTIH